MSAGSAAWRARVDASLDPRFERAFAIVDAVHAEQQRGTLEPSRLARLRQELAHLLAEIDGLVTPRTPRGTR
ncbi:hypothetical protein ACR9E3_24630 [Actinomycetospora sp. C-140]